MAYIIKQQSMMFFLNDFTISYTIDTVLIQYYYIILVY